MTGGHGWRGWFIYETITVGNPNPRADPVPAKLQIKPNEKTMKDKTKTSKTMSFYLRHHPEELGITLDPNGWVSVELFLAQLATKGLQLTFEELKHIVDTDSKGRYTLANDKPTKGTPRSRSISSLKAAFLPARSTMGLRLNAGEKFRVELGFFP